MRVLRVVVAAVVGLLACAAPALPAQAAPAQAAPAEVTGFGANPGALRMFRYVPAGLPAGRPVVVALHGCTQNGPGYGSDSGWTALAERWGFTLVLPQQQLINAPTLCFNWYNAGDADRGSGEAESIVEMVRATGGGPVYVTGVSAGGAMTASLLASYPDVFAGGAVVAGVPAGCATNLVVGLLCQNPGRDRTPAQWGDAVRARGAGPWPTMSVWHGTADFTVNPRNERELVEQWTDVHAATSSTLDAAAGYPHAVYRDAAGRAVVESWTITGMGHGQPVDPVGGCGTAAPFVLPVGVCAAQRIGEFWGLPA